MSPLRLTARASLKVPPSVPRSVMLPAIQLNGSAGWATHVCLGGHPVVGTVCVRAGWYADAGVSGAAVTLQGSMDNITFVLLISWANGLKGSGTWCHPGQPGYRYGDLVVAGYAGTGNVTAEIDTFDGVSAGSVHGGAGMS